MTTRVAGGTDTGPGAAAAGATGGGATADGNANGGAGAGNQNKKPCDKKLTKADHNRLRNGSPSPEMRDHVNAGGPPRVCPACGRTLGPGERFAADHIVPLKIIKKMPGFPCLTPAQQDNVTNNPLNFVGLCMNCNSSKGSKLWHAWQGHSQLGLGDPSVRERGMQMTKALLIELKGQIRAF